MKIIYSTLLLILIPILTTAQSDKVKTAIRTIEELSKEENFYGKSDLKITFDEVTSKITVTSSFFLTDDNHATYKTTFYQDDLDKTTFKVNSGKIDDGYWLSIEVKTNGKSVEFWSKDMDKEKFFKPMVKTELRDIVLIKSTKLLPKSFATRYIKSVQILLGIEGEYNI